MEQESPEWQGKPENCKLSGSVSVSRTVRCQNQSDSTYEEYLERKIREAVTFAGNDKLTLYLDPSDEAHKASLEQKLSVTLTISAMPFLGGVRAVIPEKNILIDNSFETLLNEERENFIFHGGVEHE